MKLKVKVKIKFLKKLKFLYSIKIKIKKIAKNKNKLKIDQIELKSEFLSCNLVSVETEPAHLLWFHSWRIKEEELLYASKCCVLQLPSCSAPLC